MGVSAKDFYDWCESDFLCKLDSLIFSWDSGGDSDSALLSSCHKAIWFSGYTEDSAITLGSYLVFPPTKSWIELKNGI